MKRALVFLLPAFFSFTSHAEQLELPLQPAQCISLSEAQKKVADYLTPLIGQAPMDDFSWITDDEILTTDDLVKAITSLKWHNATGQFETTSLVDGYCAAGASCWGWYAVDCEGTVTPFYTGED